MGGRASIDEPRKEIIGKPLSMPDPKEIDFAKIWSTAAGFGIVSGSILGPVGGLLGSVLGTGFGYWAQTFTDKQEDKAPVK